MRGRTKRQYGRALAAPRATPTAPLPSAPPPAAPRGVAPPRASPCRTCLYEGGEAGGEVIPHFPVLPFRRDTLYRKERESAEWPHRPRLYAPPAESAMTVSISRNSIVTVRAAPRVRSRYRFRNRGTESLCESGIKWISARTMRQRFRALAAPPRPAGSTKLRSTA
jgi:hypothetical protein